MMNEDMGSGGVERNIQNLAKAMNEIRSHQADREDVVVELRHAKLSRLELLRDDLKPVIRDIPKNCDRFEFAIAKGDSPRLWVDMTTFVRLAGDGSEYELVKDTRMGRQVMARASSRSDIANSITAYVAEILLERERMLEGDWVSHNKVMKKALEEQKENHAEDTKQHSRLEASESRSPAAGFVNAQRHSSLSLLLWFVLGLVSGGLILCILYVFGFADKIVQSVI